MSLSHTLTEEEGIADLVNKLARYEMWFERWKADLEKKLPLEEIRRRVEAEKTRLTKIRLAKQMEPALTKTDRKLILFETEADKQRRLENARIADERKERKKATNAEFYKKKVSPVSPKTFKSHSS